MKKSIGIDVKPPEKVCKDTRCPWHGSLSVRGRIFEGRVKSVRMMRTAVVEWEYHHWVPKYERFEKKRSKVSAHNPDCIKAKEGDNVLIAECRPLSKTKNFVIVAKIEKEGQK
ncbi:MAG: 30S ribosomal protein S17 [Candidatus Aenigmatarchaeota archaeon]